MGTTVVRASRRYAELAQERAKKQGVPVAYVIDAALRTLFELPSKAQERAVQSAGAERHESNEAK